MTDKYDPLRQLLAEETDPDMRRRSLVFCTSVLLFIDENTCENEREGARNLLLSFDQGSEVIERLERLQREDAPTHAVLAVRDRLDMLQQGAHAQQQSENRKGRKGIFDDLCASVANSFPNVDSLTDQDIRENPATPDLVRYLLDSFKRFHKAKTPLACTKWDNDDRPRHAALAAAFLATNTSGPPLKILLRKDDILEAALSASKAVRNGGPPSIHSQRAGLAAAYAVYRQGEKGAQNSRDERQALQEIWDTLVHELAWPARRPRKQLQKRG